MEAERREAVKMKATKAERLLIRVYRKNLLNTIDCIEYAKRLNGFYSLDIVKKLERLLNKNGQSDILTLGFVGYLVLIVIVALCIF